MADRDLRVLLVDLARTFGGAEVRVLAQARGLQDRTAACHVAVLRGSALHSQLEMAGLPCEPVAAGRASPALLWALRSLIRRGAYHIVDAHNVQSILWGHFSAALAGAPGRVATIHSDYGGEYPGLKGSLYEGVLWLDRLVVRETINVTEVLQAKSERQGNAAHSTLIHNAVPVPDRPLTHKNPVLLREWGYGPDDFVIACIARLKPVKGHTYLIDALARLGDLPHVRLLLVGDGPLRADLEAQAAALGLTERVRFAGFRQDVSGILQAVDAVCLASLSEGLPYAVLEAGSYARPLLVTAVGGMATLLEDRKTALLVLPRDPEALAEGMRWLVAHPAEAQRMGLAAYDLVRRSFSVESMIEQVLRVYHRALRR